MQPFVSVICKSCPVNCDKPLYITTVVQAIGYFLKGIKEKDEKYIKAIENPAKSPLFDSSIKIEATFKHNGYDVTKTGPFCNRYKST